MGYWHLRLLGVVGPLLVLSVAVVFQSNPSVADDPAEVADRPVELTADGYVGSSQCAECHHQQHESWFDSFHRTMTQTVTPETAPSVIDDAKVEVDDLSLHFFRRGDRYFVRFDDPLESGQELVEKELLMMTGSHHMHVFWYESPVDGIPAIVPAVYLIDQQRWIPRRASFVRPPHLPHSAELGRWNSHCSLCHTVHPRSRFDRQTHRYDTRVAEFGIACEACHGPGTDHIALHRGQSGRVEEAGDVVVNPEELAPELKSDVCGQCHSVFLMNRDDQAAFAEYLRSGFRFRPGEDVEESQFRKIVRANPELRETTDYRDAAKRIDLSSTFWSDGVVRVSGREFNGLIESPCYQHGTLSCLSCHEMHPDSTADVRMWRDDQLKPKMRTNAACTSCHAEPEYTKNLSEHTHHLADSAGSNCMNCHMPHTVYGLLKAVRSHHIESPSASVAATTGRPTGCNTCHLDNSLGWTADHLTQWYGLPRPTLNSEQERLASGALNLLKGDAGLRALTASLYAWEPARETSGTDWMAPFLLIGMLDDYDAVRVVSRKTLATLPGWEKIVIDEFGDAAARTRLITQYLAFVKQKLRLEPRAELLFGDDGSFAYERASKLFQGRDQRPITLNE